MKFYEEVTDQDLDVWHNPVAGVPDTLLPSYHEYLSSAAEAAEEINIAILREREALIKANESLTIEKESLIKQKDLVDGQIKGLTESLHAIHKDLKDKGSLVQSLKESLEQHRKELNECRAEITSLKMHTNEGSQSNTKRITDGDSEIVKAPAETDNYEAEIKSLKIEIEKLKVKTSIIENHNVESIKNLSEDSRAEVVEIHELDKTRMVEQSIGSVAGGPVNTEDHPVAHNVENISTIFKKVVQKLLTTTNSTSTADAVVVVNHKISDHTSDHSARAKKDVEELTKIAPDVLIDHHEKFFPLIVHAIEHHPDSNTRDSLTHTLFNLIKRPDKQQRKTIMDACVTLARNVGEMRTELELLPRCWEQINHSYMECRVLVAQSCGELAEFVRPEIRDSLILSIIEQLAEDSVTGVRDNAAHNLAILLPLIPNINEYFKVEKLMFQLVLDRSLVVARTSVTELVPAVARWGNNHLDHILCMSLSHLLGSALKCPPISGDVEGSVESHLRVVGEIERRNIDFMLRMLIGLIPFVHQKAIETWPFASTMNLERGSEVPFFSTTVLEVYGRGQVVWPVFDWIHTDCLPTLIRLSCLLPQKEIKLRRRLAMLLLAVSEHFGREYCTHFMQPVFEVMVGDKSADFTMFPSTLKKKIRGLRPSIIVVENLAVICVLPLLLAGIFGSPGRSKELAGYLRELILQPNTKQFYDKTGDHFSDALRFVCTFPEHYKMIRKMGFNVNMRSDLDMTIRPIPLVPLNPDIE